MRNPPPSDAPATSKHSWGKRGHSVIRPEHVTITGVWKNKLICEHGGDWRRCRVCSPDLFCVHHHRLIYKCKKCRILRMCDVHQKSRDRCKCPVPPGVAEAIESQLPLCAHHQDPHMCQDPVCVEKRQGNPKRVTGKATPGKRGSHRAEVITPTDGQQPAEHPGVSVTDCIICRPHLFCMHQIKRSGCCVCAAEVIAWRRERQRRECQCAHGNAEPACVTCHPLAATCFHGMETRDCGVCMEEREGTAGRNRGDGNIGEEEREEGEAESGRRRHQRVRCEHGWVFACPLCFPALTCQHESIFSACTMCMTSLKKYAVWRGEQVATTERVRPFPGPPDQMDFGGDDSDDAEDHAPPPIPQRKGKATALPSEQPPRVLQHKSKATNRPSLAQPSIAQSNTGDETSPLDTQIPPPSDAPATSKRLDPVNRPEYVTKTGVWENKLVCEHEVNPRRCHVCRPDLFCVHNRLTYGCRKCHILRMCDVHQTSRDRCKCPVPPRVAEVVEIEMPLCAHHQDPHMCQGPVCVEKRQGNPKRVTGKTTLGGKGSHRAEGITPTDDQHPAEHPGVSVTDCIICRPHLFCMHQIKRSGCNICAPEVIAWRRERQRRECQCVHGNAELACVTCHPELAATCFHGMETRDCGVCMEEREGPAGSNRGDGNVGQEEGEGGEGESRQRKYHRVPCEHGQAFACPLCFPALTCQHESTFSACTICMTSLKKYGRWPGERDATKKVGTCQHGNPGKYCIECRPHLGCKHNKISQWCKVCCREIKRWREQKRKKERMCMHGSLEVSCNTCGLELSAVCPHDVAARDCAVCLGEREKKLDSINARCRHRKPPEECVVCMDEGDTEIDSQEEPGGKGGGTGGGANGKGRKQRRAKRKVYHCEHGTVLACPLCFPELVCKHKITFSTCTVCMASLRRSHRWSSGESNIEKKRPAHPRGGRERPLCSEHGQQKNLCIECRPHMGCQHGRFLTKCKTCSKEVRLWREQKWREEHMCMHGCLEISCETCELELNVVCPHDVAARDCAVCLGEREKESELLSRCYHGVPTSECSVCMEERENKDGQTEGEERGEETQTEGEEEERKETQMEGEEGEDGEEERRGKRGGKPFMHRTYRCDHGNLMACPLCCPQLVCMHRVIFSTCTVCMTSLREYRPVVWWGTDRPKEQDTAPTPRITGQRGRRQPPKSWSDYTDSESDTPASLRQLANVHDSLNLATRTQIHLLPLRVRYRAKENGCLNHGATPPMHLHPNG